MTERPILFNTEMVKAILEGRKTQTRRVVKPQPPEWSWSIRKWDADCVNVSFNNNREYWVKTPYGQPGDLLWVREAWRVRSWHEGEPIEIEYKDGATRDESSDGSEPNIEDWYERMWIQCAEDCEKAKIPLSKETEIYEFGDRDLCTRWRPSIHIPRWCSRITLRVKDVRVERVQEISEEAAITEGFPRDEWFDRYALDWFETLWDSINGKRGFGWESNPWVWVVEFEVVE